MKKLTHNDKIMIHALIKDNINQRINEINKFHVRKMNAQGEKRNEEKVKYKKRNHKRKQEWNKR